MRKADQLRKREERSVRKALQQNRKFKEFSGSYLADDKNFESFSNQLASIGLKLRDIPGDGNCLFRALADQLDGHHRKHFQHRLDTVKYMIDNRCDFEPFVEDDCSFDKHVEKLALDGTYGGNDTIVAFARNNSVNVVIHQLNAPMWTINGSDRSNCRQLHIAYHNGDHYSSVRKLNDNSESTPNIRLVTKIEKKVQPKRENSKKQQLPLNLKKQIQQVVNVTGCQDQKLIQQTLEDCDYDIDCSIGVILQLTRFSDTSDEDGNNSGSRESSGSNRARKQQQQGAQLWDAAGTGTRIFGNQVSNTRNQPSHTAKKGSNRQRKDAAKKERKKRGDERKRTVASNNNSDSDESAVVLKNMDILKI